MTQRTPEELALQESWETVLQLGQDVISTTFFNFLFDFGGDRMRKLFGRTPIPCRQRMLLRFAVEVVNGLDPTVIDKFRESHSFLNLTDDDFDAFRAAWLAMMETLLEGWNSVEEQKAWADALVQFCPMVTHRPLKRPELVETWQEVRRYGEDKAMELFYSLLFEASRPEVRAIFNRTNMQHLRRILTTFVVEVLAPEVGESIIDRVRLAHAGLGLNVDDFYTFEDCFLEMLTKVCEGRGLSEEATEAWRGALRMFLPLFETVSESRKSSPAGSPKRANRRKSVPEMFSAAKLMESIQTLAISS